MRGKYSPGFDLPQWGSRFALTPKKFGANWSAHLDKLAANGQMAGRDAQEKTSIR
jgi:hypothetical protein